MDKRLVGNRERIGEPPLGKQRLSLGNRGGLAGRSNVARATFPVLS
jgi:hypothetical protein